jgi:ubiquinone/menaquinone biosynthesis C-methylase UbiE
MDYRKETYWSRFADTFNEDQRYIVGEGVQRQLMAKLAEEKFPGELLELGCGAGFYTRPLASNCAQLLATDLSDEMLAIAKTKLQDLPNVTLEKADCEQTGFPDGRFGCVFMANLVHVLENPSLVLSESHRILKDKGMIIVVGYTSHGLSFIEKIKLIFRYLKVWGRPPKGFRSYAPDELRGLVESAGFEVEEVELIGESSKGIYLRGRKR